MLPDLEHLVHLQSIDNTAEDARRTLEELPARQAALDSRIAEAEAVLSTGKQRLAASQAARRELEKELATVQSRLSKYKDQLMEVKTNREYQAMQNEIATAEREVRTREDRILDHMEAAEEETRLVKDAERQLNEEHAVVTAERRMLEKEREGLEKDLTRLAAEREALRGKIESEALRLFDHIARQRRGIAVVEARDGHCSFCHVRLRPQVFNEIRRNDRIVQCDSCQRILYYNAAANQAASS